MDNIIEFTGLINNCKIALDNRTIIGVMEMEASHNVENNIVEHIPEHRLIITEKMQFRVSDSYNAIIKKINDINFNDRLGL